MREQPALRWHALHVLGISAIAIAQPLFDTVARNSEFLVAHRPRPVEVFALVGILVLALPAIPIGLAWLAGRVSRGLERAVILATLLALALLVALQVLKRTTDWSLPWMAGTAAAAAAAFVVSYWFVAGVRRFVSVLSVAVAVVPAVFLLDRSIRTFWQPRAAAAASTRAPAAPTPIVLVLFDQLPLVSLLDERDEVDARLYPSFSALARESVWFRNATSVAERTGMGLPAILTGRYPRPSTLPSDGDHPDNLFTWLGKSHTVWAFEPITALCPTTLCQGSVSSSLERVGGILGDLSTVYLHLVAPEELTVGLPQVTQNWRDFEVPTWQRRWRRMKRTDRRDPLTALLDALQPPGPAPTFYFTHVLLPHEPFMYLPSERRYDAPGTPVFGHSRGEVWTTDPWPVAVSQQRQLLQTVLVDRLLGRVVTRLREVGLYDECLLIVTSDHGAAFVPGEPFKDPAGANYAEIMAVPLFIKLPHGREAGRVDDRNVETIDVVPTVADVLGTSTPWPTDGASALSGAPRPMKRVYWGGARNSREVAPLDVARDVRAAVRRKQARFGAPPDLSRIQGVDPAWQLVGRRVADLPVVDQDGISLALAEGGKFTDVDRGGPFQPTLIEGLAASLGRTGSGATLAVAVNGVIQSVARVWYRSERLRGHWMSVVPEEVFQPGMNDVRVFEILAGPGARWQLRRTDAVSPDTTRGNLLEGSWAGLLGVQPSGFYSQEHDGARDRPFRWTSGHARLEIPFDRAHPPRSLTVGVINGGRPNRRFEIRLDTCQLYAGNTPAGGWRQTFSLDRCRVGAPTFTIHLETEPFTPGGGDSRQLGVAIDYLSLRSH